MVNQDINSMYETADNELRSIGENRVAYISVISKETQADITAQIEDLSEFTDLWGVYSAAGELLIICSSPVTAWEYADEHELKAVRTH